MKTPPGLSTLLAPDFGIRPQVTASQTGTSIYQKPKGKHPQNSSPWVGRQCKRIHSESHPILQFYDPSSHSSNTLPNSKYLAHRKCPFLYRHIDDVERQEFYRIGGYHSTETGDLFHRIMHTLS
ncbi:hypothetical protein LZ30DRAFT_733778 [Colletotrichum cereale]|nr:hypothetical protein LZ30DRAFT_733778 [Colletotrichum cereale]